MDIADVDSSPELGISDVDSSPELDTSHVDSSPEMHASTVDPLAEMEARNIFREVYSDFYDWEQAGAQASIDSLACKNPDDSFPDCGEYILGGMDAGLIDDNECIVINIENEIEPHPPYTSCAPVSRNVLLSPQKSDLGLDLGLLSHVPYADHPAFNKEQFLQDCFMLIPNLKYAWQKDFGDPDVEIIFTEVVKRLYNANIPVNMLGNLLGSVGHDSGLLWSMHQRDRPNVLDWFENDEVETLLNIRNELPSFKTWSVFDAINTCEPAYCSLCQRVACGTHRPERDKTTNMRLPVLLEKMAKLSAEELHDLDVTPCGADCFKHLDMDGYEDESKAESEIDKDQFIIGVLKLDPDILPCDLSFTSKVPCKKIFLYRARFLSQREDRPDAGRTSSGPSQLVAHRDPPKPPSQSFSLPVYPCVHDGPCDETVIGCQCYLTNRQCLHSCNCALTCDRRRKGCSCYKKGGCTVSNECPCAMKEQECDPELCRKCGARNQIAQNQVDLDAPATVGPDCEYICNNVNVQGAAVGDELICIRRSKYGSGAFLSSGDVLKADTYLGEYYGQIKRNDASLKVAEILARYTNRNYMFELNKEITIDATSMGNVTRYLNDKPMKKAGELSKGQNKYANCDSKIFYANEEQHIMLNTGPALPPRKELTLCYGDGFWKTAASEGSEEET